MNTTESIIQGETFRLGVFVNLSDGDSDLISADLVVFDESGIKIEKTSTFILNNENNLTTKYEADLSTSDTNIPVGTYEYFVRINWEDGTNDIVPDLECIESGECEYPNLIICSNPDNTVVS